MPRYKQDALRELNAVCNRLASQRKTARDTVKPETAAICDKVIVSLERQERALRAEIPTLPEQPARVFHPTGDFQFRLRNCLLDPLSEEEIKQLELPSFLRRT